MARAPFQVIVFPFLTGSGGDPLYAVFERRGEAMWQAVSGGGEDAETPLEAAVRELREETGIAARDGWIALDARASIPVTAFEASRQWPADLFVIPEHAFGVEVPDRTIRLSAEHRAVAWLPYADARARLTWDSNKVALWELDRRVRGLGPRGRAGARPI